jgi:hypothetical protein
MNQQGHSNGSGVFDESTKIPDPFVFLIGERFHIYASKRE